MPVACRNPGSRVQSSRLVALGALACLCLLASPVLAQNAASAASPDEAMEETPSESRGRSNRGRLLRGVELHDSDVLEVKRGSENARFGTAELVNAVEAAARAVAERYPGSLLVVGDLSREGGGRLSPHRSHQSGLDADIGFYLVDESGEAASPPRFVNIRRSGCGDVQGRTYCLDEERSLALLAELVSHPDVQVQYVLIAPYLRRRLLRAAEAVGLSQETLARIETVTSPHRGSHVHQNHFHLRIYCPPNDRPSCLDMPPFHDWYVGAPPEVDHRAIRRQRRSWQRHSVQRQRQRDRLRRQRAQERRRAQARRQARPRARQERARARAARARARRRQ